MKLICVGSSMRTKDGVAYCSINAVDPTPLTGNGELGFSVASFNCSPEVVTQLATQLATGPIVVDAEMTMRPGQKGATYVKIVAIKIIAKLDSFVLNQSGLSAKAQKAA